MFSRFVMAAAAVGAVIIFTRAKPAAPILAKPTSGQPVQDAFARVDAYVKTQLTRLNIPGAALAIVEGDKIVHMCAFGAASPTGEAPTPQSPFFIGSLTKSITALAVMQLVEAGKVELDAPVQRYLPWFRVADSQVSAQMTVRHLLNQTSGLSQVVGMTPLADLSWLLLICGGFALLWSFLRTRLMLGSVAQEGAKFDLHGPCAAG